MGEISGFWYNRKEIIILSKREPSLKISYDKNHSNMYLLNSPINSAPNYVGTYFHGFMPDIKPLWKLSCIVYWNETKNQPPDYSCNKTTKTWIQISCQNWFGFFSNISHHMTFSLTPIVFRSKSNWYQTQKIKKCALNLQLQTIEILTMFWCSFWVFLISLLL